jgi:hypothetical protein
VCQSQDWNKDSCAGNGKHCNQGAEPAELSYQCLKFKRICQPAIPGALTPPNATRTCCHSTPARAPHLLAGIHVLRSVLATTAAAAAAAAGQDMAHHLRLCHAARSLQAG